MHHLVRPTDVARREDMRHIRLLRRLRHNFPSFRFYPGSQKVQPLRVRFPAQRLQDLLRLHTPLLSVLEEFHPLFLSLLHHPLDLGPAKHFTALLAEHPGQGVAHLRVRLRQ